MDAATDEELLALRARAYGPNADIAGDQAAFQRLQYLEGRVPDDDVDEADAVASILQSEIEVPVESLTDSDDFADAAEHDASIHSDSHAARRRRRGAVLWIAAVVVSSALTAAITYSLTKVDPVSAPSGTQIATLEPSSAVTIPLGWFGADEDTTVFDFYGLALFTGEDPRRPAPYSECLSVVRTDLVPAEEEFDPSGWSFNGELYSDCGVGAFTPTVSVPFSDIATDELRQRYPAANALQFVLDGDRVGVFIDSE